MTALPPEKLRPRCDPSSLPFRTTDELPDHSDLIGQDRALEAIRLSAEVTHRDFNLFVLGPSGTGRHAATEEVLKAQSGQRPLPVDWVYVNNFDAPHKPRALSLPPGHAPRLRAAMQDLVNDLARDLPAVFESDEYQTQRRAIDQEYAEKQEGAMSDFADAARAEGVALLRTPMGFMLTALKDGEVLKTEDFGKLPEKEQDEIEEKIARLQEDLADVLRQAPRLERAHAKRIEQLNAETAARTVSSRIEEFDPTLRAIKAVSDYVLEVEQDITAHADLFLQAAAQGGDGGFPGPLRKFHEDPAFDRYVVNVMVSHSGKDGKGAPVETEHTPTLDRLVGRIEHVSQMGSLVTNFTMIKPGALHRANGGFLMLEARALLSEPFAWDALKQCLKTRSINITSLAERISMMSTTSLEPDPIPLDLRIVLIGDRMLHALLVMLDPDFGDLFKIQADFEESVPRGDRETDALYARLIGAYSRREGLPAITAAGVARIIDEAARRAEDNTRLSLRLGQIGDLVKEAAHYAKARGAAHIEAEDIDHACEAQDRRAGRIKDRMQEAIGRGTVMIDTQGAQIGQINGLSVIGLGNYSFGRPSRITARVRMGAGKLVDIEREVELGGPLHSKGVMILSGYLTSRYALDVPFSLHASLVFEQSYGGIDGDSASSAELYALLSALADAPLDQGLAVTGSVNQAGEVQAIGGVNEKIEGFFETCRARGLTGTQGVLIPKANVEHLMLNDDVVAAAREGKFRVIPVSTIDEGISLLTGIDAGSRDESGRFPKGSINARVEARLRGFAETRRDFLRRKTDGGDAE